MLASAVEWLESLPRQLDPHRIVLRRLMRETDRDDRIRLIIVGCSIGRGVADALSDIDAYVGVRPWLPFLAGLEPLLGRLGEVVDLYHQRLARAEAAPYQRTFVLYRSGVQLDLVIADAPEAMPRRPDWVVLHDPDGRVSSEAGDRNVTLEQIRTWAYEGWEHLAACAKYLARGSLWEAHEQLHSARTQTWRLWAVARRVADPQYGLTAVLDEPQAPLPPNIDATLARLERRDLAVAALTCADLLSALWPDAVAAVVDEPAPLPPLAGYVRSQLAAVMG
jgi:hypothetical protein